MSSEIIFRAEPVLTTDTNTETSFVIHKEVNGSEDSSLVVLPAKGTSYILKKRGRTVQAVNSMSLSSWAGDGRTAEVATGVNWIPFILFNQANVRRLACLFEDRVMRLVYPYIKDGTVILPVDGWAFGNGDYVNSDSSFAAIREPFRNFVAMTDDEREAYRSVLHTIMGHPVNRDFLKRVNGAMLMGVSVSPKNVLSHTDAVRGRDVDGISVRTLFLWEKAASILDDFMSSANGVTRFVYNMCGISPLCDFVDIIMNENGIPRVQNYAWLGDYLKTAGESIVRNGYDGRSDESAAAIIVDDAVNALRDLSHKRA